MNTPKTITLDEAKIQASILLKSLRSEESAKVQSSIHRIRGQGRFQDYEISQLIITFKLKHALEIIALENNFSSWRELKNTLDNSYKDDFVGCYVGGHLNHWFTNYDEAKRFQRAHGGYLLPYKEQVFVCDADYISQIGLNPNDENWKNIDNDWIKPTSKKSWSTLRKNISKLKKGGW